ncbi:hypothetical protein [Mesomycoplasma dispar]|uniref:Uncharacterized protein n=1 Tax=Mesomycoplasma dispar TaxID=86660 RepID=A0ABM6PRN6_9BACT|nr:hypothetical protein [Mesomycoplasma dispar]ATP59708.1 hypothetical protein CSW10_02045 [Mesomycoplasma dispar]
MRRSLKWVLTLTPLAVGSVAATIYLTSENLVSNFGENTNGKKVSVETRISPLASSQDNETNLKTEKLNNQKPLDEPVAKTKKIITPVLTQIPKELKKNQKPKNLTSPAILLTNKQDLAKTKVEQKPKKQPQILLANSDIKTIRTKRETSKNLANSEQEVKKSQDSVALLGKKVPKTANSQNQSTPIVQKVVIVNDKRTEKPAQSESSPNSTVVGNANVTPKDSQVQETVPNVSTITVVSPQQNPEKEPEKKEKQEENQSENEVKIQDQSETKGQDSSKTKETDKPAKKIEEKAKPEERIEKPSKTVIAQTPSGSETPEKAVERIIKDVEKDLQTLLNKPIGNESSEVKTTWWAAKNRLSDFRFADQAQMNLFKEKIAKTATPITEEQSGYLLNLWENNYYHFNPGLSTSRTRIEQLRNELRKVLNIIKKPEIGPFNRVSGGTSFIINLDENGKSDWTSAS